MLQCNCSILGDETSGEAIVIDPGDDIPRIVQLLEKHHLTVKQILITHAHIDHIAGAARLKKLTGAPILYNPRDLPLVKMMDMQAGWLGMPTPEVPQPDDTLEEGRIITLGSGLVARGFSLGSPLGYAFDQDRIILSIAEGSLFKWRDTDHSPKSKGPQ
jgi:glyoxylase-like metal-dependent hydrolase (beta-lactamase superfamily II)